jgi:hypothetical protein
MPVEMSNVAYDRMFSAENGYPQRPDQPEQPQSPEGIYAEQFKSANQQLDQDYEQALASTQEETKRAISLLREQSRIKWDAVDQDRSIDAAAKSKRKSDLETQYEVQAAAINSKQAPATQSLQQAYEQQQREMQAQFKSQQESDAQLVRLGQEGKIDPAEVLAERWSKALGRSIPASAFRGKAGNIEQRKTALEDDIRDMDRILGGFTDATAGFFKGALTGAKRGQFRYEDPATGEMQNLNPRNKADAVIIARFRELLVAKREKETEFAELLINNDPVLGPAARIQKDWAAANAALSKNGRKGGGLSAGIVQAKGKPPLPPIGETIQRLRAGGLEREEIRIQLKVLGYK